MKKIMFIVVLAICFSFGYWNGTRNLRPQENKSILTSVPTLESKEKEAKMVDQGAACENQKCYLEVIEPCPFCCKNGIAQGGYNIGCATKCTRTPGCYKDGSLKGSWICRESAECIPG